MPAIRRHVHIAANPRAVWNALTTAEGLSRWLAQEARVDGWEGGRFVLHQANGDGEPLEERGMIHKWRPTSQLEISWDNIGVFEAKGSQVSFQVARDGKETRLSLVQSGGEALEDDERRAAIDLGWKQAFERLQSWLDQEES